MIDSLSCSDLLHRFDVAVDRLRSTYAADGPGFCIGLAQGAQVLRRVSHGLAHLEWAQPVTADTCFYLASEAKPWTAALVLDAVVQRQLRLDEDVRRRLPALADCDQPILLGHLLRHTSGLPDYLSMWAAQLGRHAHDVLTQADALELIRRCCDPEFAPGSQHRYSNSNYVLLAELAQQAAGCSLAELAQRRCFGPWGMRRTRFEPVPWRVMDCRARSYAPEQTEQMPVRWLDVPVTLGSWGDGGLWSTATDLLRAECLWQSDPTGPVAQFLLRGAAEADGQFGPRDHPYCFGLEVVRQHGLRFVFHGGGYAAFTSLLLRCPAQACSLVVLGNVDGFDATIGTWLAALWGD